MAIPGLNALTNSSPKFVVVASEQTDEYVYLDWHGNHYQQTAHIFPEGVPGPVVVEYRFIEKYFVGGIYQNLGLAGAVNPSLLSSLPSPQFGFATKTLLRCSLICDDPLPLEPKDAGKFVTSTFTEEGEAKIYYCQEELFHRVSTLFNRERDSGWLYQKMNRRHGGLNFDSYRDVEKQDVRFNPPYQRGCRWGKWQNPEEQK